jgi:hypothetical protein
LGKILSLKFKKTRPANVRKSGRRAGFPGVFFAHILTLKMLISGAFALFAATRRQRRFFPAFFS